MVDIDFIAQYLQLVHAADKPDILDVSTSHVLDKSRAARRVCRNHRPKSCVRRRASIMNLTQILRLCVTEKFNPETAGEDLPADHGPGRRCAGLFLP